MLSTGKGNSALSLLSVVLLSALSNAVDVMDVLFTLSKFFNILSQFFPDQVCANRSHNFF